MNSKIHVVTPADPGVAGDTRVIKSELLARSASITAPAELWSEDAFCEVTGTPKRTAQRWRSTGEGPPYVRLGPRRIAYRPEDVARWLESRTYRHRADELSRSATEAEAEA
ncbi:AlpA family transcriptional regulator [Roseomonas sp. HF4]|uniref:helix-turn-helix transcriptional regulator n=1 Tax=Roseomonas sp. HF4 TaxID=2562313 RepID=UPI001484E482|nr:helix-turn-helix domain-containing protein [Roseomonas sp. HF4]